MIYEIISSVKGCRIAHIVTLTEEKLPKKLGLTNVTTRFEGEVQLNYSYENAANNRLEKQGNDRTFNALDLPWGQWEMENKIITHNGVRYLRYYITRGNKPKVEYFVNGRPATPIEVAIIVAYKHKPMSKRQAAEGLIENQVKPRAVKFDNVLSLKVVGRTYVKTIQSTLQMVG